MKRYALTLLVLSSTFMGLQAQNQTAQKYIPVELFTNTWCSLCTTYDPPATNTYLNNKKSVHLITYYPSVPYPQCPFYQANPIDNNARKNYYNINSTPRTKMYGTINGSATTLLTQSNIDSNYGDDSPLRIEVLESGPSTNTAVTVNVKTFDTVPTGDLRLYVAAVVEYTNFNAQNGLTEHYNTLWQFLSNENGDAITPASLGNANTYTYNYNTNNLTHTSYMASEVYVIAFVQKNNTKEVINSGSSKDIIVDAIITDAACGSANGAIDLNISGGETGSYNIAWSNGMQIEDISNLAPGNYTVVVNDGANAETYSTITVGGNNQVVTLNGLPVVTSSNAPITLTGNPAGGSFSGSGVVFNAFNPAIAGIGSHSVTYTVNGCSTSQNIFVFSITYNFVNYNLGVVQP